jgi:hypothetical protein
MSEWGRPTDLLNEFPVEMATGIGQVDSRARSADAVGDIATDFNSLTGGIAASGERDGALEQLNSLFRGICTYQCINTPI